MKDKKWLKEELDKSTTGFNGRELSRYEMGRLDGYTHATMLLDELDEPETLSEKWIENHTASADTISYYSDENVPVVTVEKLKNLLVPKQDKPVLPQFVADWIERQKQPDWDYDKKEDALADSIHFTLYSLGANYRKANPNVVLRKPVNEWLNDDRKNYWKLIDGVRYGYEVEKKQKYQVIIRDGEYIRLYLCKHGDNVIIGTNDNYIEKCPEVTYLTEKEIKDYDERYWAFAKEVTE